MCRGCLLVRQSFFHDDSRMLTDVGGGVAGCRGLHSSFRPTHGGLSLNIGKRCYIFIFLPLCPRVYVQRTRFTCWFDSVDVSTTMILTPGPVIDFLKANQGARDARAIDWIKVKVHKTASEKSALCPPCSLFSWLLLG